MIFNRVFVEHDEYVFFPPAFLGENSQEEHNGGVKAKISQPQPCWFIFRFKSHRKVVGKT